MGVGLALTLFIVLQGVKCEHWNLIVPQKIVGIEGSCVSVPCSFELPSKYKPDLQNCSTPARWKKGDVLGPNAKNARVVGDLANQNCTTVFQSLPKELTDLFLFRLDCLNSDLKYTFRNGVIVSFQTVVAPPALASVSHVTEGDQVTLQCSAMVPCPSLPPSLMWTTPGSRRREQSQIIQNSDGQMMLQSTLTFTAAAHHHNRNIICSVSYPLTAGGSTEPAASSRRLTVSYGPRQTAAKLSVSGPVSESRVVNFTCSSDANPPVTNYTWYKDSHGRLLKQGEGESMVLQVTHGDGGLYLCEARSERGSQKSNTVALDVNSPAGCRESLGTVPYVACGALAALYIVTLAVGLYKYKSLSRRLKQPEQKREHIYSDLQTCSTTSDYNQIQPKVKPSRKESNYENVAALRLDLKQQPTRGPED